MLIFKPFLFGCTKRASLKPQRPISGIRSANRSKAYFVADRRVSKRTSPARSWNSRTKNRVAIHVCSRKRVSSSKDCQVVSTFATSVFHLINLPCKASTRAFKKNSLTKNIQISSVQNSLYSKRLMEKHNDWHAYERDAKRSVVFTLSCILLIRRSSLKY